MVLFFLLYNMQEDCDSLTELSA